MPAGANWIGGVSLVPPLEQGTPRLRRALAAGVRIELEVGEEHVQLGEERIVLEAGAGHLGVDLLRDASVPPIEGGHAVSLERLAVDRVHTLKDAGDVPRNLLQPVCRGHRATVQPGGRPGNTVDSTH